MTLLKAHVQQLGSHALFLPNPVNLQDFCSQCGTGTAMLLKGLYFNCRFSLASTCIYRCHMLQCLKPNIRAVEVSLLGYPTYQKRYSSSFFFFFCKLQAAVQLAGDLLRSKSVCWEVHIPSCTLLLWFSLHCTYAVGTVVERSCRPESMPRLTKPRLLVSLQFQVFHSWCKLSHFFSACSKQTQKIKFMPSSVVVKSQRCTSLWNCS